VAEKILIIELIDAADAVNGIIENNDHQSVFHSGSPFYRRET
jgi:hypothetical protein